MTNVLYPAARDAFLRGEIDMIGDTIKASLVNLDNYTYDASHSTLSDLSSVARVATVSLGTKSVSGGIFDAGDATFGTVLGFPVEALIIWQDEGVDATSRLIAYFDTDVIGLPVTPNGGSIPIVWSASGVFAL